MRMSPLGISTRGIKNLFWYLWPKRNTVWHIPNETTFFILSSSCSMSESRWQYLAKRTTSSSWSIGESSRATNGNTSVIKCTRQQFPKDYDSVKKKETFQLVQFTILIFPSCRTGFPWYGQYNWGRYFWQQYSIIVSNNICPLEPGGKKQLKTWPEIENIKCTYQCRDISKLTEKPMAAPETIKTTVNFWESQS